MTPKQREILEAMDRKADAIKNHISTTVTLHNTDTTSHADIRAEIEHLSDQVETLQTNNTWLLD